MMRIAASGVIVIVAAVLATGATVRAQHSGPRHAGHDTAQMCEREFQTVVGEGLGFGMAFAADKNGYPGPRHVLELKHRLRLTPAQEARTQALLDEMFAQSRPRSARLLEAERRLGQLFAASGADEAAVARTVAEVERARADVRLVHLLFHLRTRDVLTAAQREEYRRARWDAPDHR
ncbi:MAG TPA: periplasmic heavy metal sensor [Methylomirabilota bacterium]